MPRTGSFPLSVAVDLLQAFGHPGQVLLDPFCGKGTSLLAGRLLGLHPFGLDIAPEAIHCSRAKIDEVTLDEVTEYVDNLYLGSGHDEAPADVRSLFSPTTLRQLLSIRRTLLSESTEPGKKQSRANMALAATLGILHGHADYSLSISSAHAYSMAPGYVTKFAREHGLKKPRRSVKRCLKEKLKRVIKDPLPAVRMGGVVHADVLDIADALRPIRGEVDIVLTSPPYLDSQTYAKDNWLRLWYLGYDYRKLHSKYLHTSSLSRYSTSIEAAFDQIREMLRPGGACVCVIGDVRQRSTGQMVNTSLLVARAMNRVGLKPVACTQTRVKNQRRYLHALSGTNGHKSYARYERVLVAQKPRG